MTDAELLKQYVSGSQPAFAEIVRRHAGMVHANCLRILRDAHSADDATQAAFLVLVRKARRLPASTVLSDWLFLTSRYTALDLRRKLARQRDREREAGMAAQRTTSGGEGKDPGTGWAEVGPVLDTAMASLPRAQRRALVLCYLEGKSQQEAAAELGCGRSTVATWVSRGLERLRAKLGRLGVGVGAAALPVLLLENAAPAAPAALLASIQATCLGTAAASPAVLAVAEGAAGAMLWAKAKTLGITVLAVALASGGGAWALKAVALGAPAGRDLPANTWVKAPDSAEFRELRRFRAMISGTSKSQHGNWLFQAKRSNFSATAQGVWLPAQRRIMFVSGRDGRTWKYDPATGGDWNRRLKPREKPSGWTNLGPGGDAFTPHLRWASMCLDPVNNEVVLFGGNSADPNGSPGTMIYSLADNNWRRLDFSKLPLARQHDECERLRQAIRQLEGRMRSRWHLAETSAESKENLVSAATSLAARIEQLSAALKASDNQEKAQITWAGPELSAAASALKSLKAESSPAAIADLGRAAEHLRAARDALAVEPAARANSPLVFDPASGKLLLFGGDGLDRLMSDTWTYDPETRRWSQHWPDVAPAPRAGHALVHLPESGRVAMLGGYAYSSREGYGGAAYRRRPLELWIFDVAGNRWQRLGEWTSATAPVSPVSGVLEVVVSPDDVIVTGKWALRVDPASAATSASEQGVTPGTIARRSGKFAPSWWDELPAPDAAANQKFLATIPVNTWVAVKPPKTLNVNRDKSTATFDVDRGQILFFGGGRSAYSGTDVHMYSVRANRWRTGFYADMPVNFCGRTGNYGQRWSFASRPFISSHTFKLYAYDPGSKKMLCYNRGDTFVFDPAAGDWESKPVKSTPFTGHWVPKFCTTTDGLLVWSNPSNRKNPNRLWRFDRASRAWQAVSTSGEQLPNTPSDDYGTLVYDSKRKRALMFVTSRTPRGPWACDLAGGAVKNLKAPNPKAAPDQPREAVYLPAADIVLFTQTHGKAPQSIVYDCAQNKYRLLKLAPPLKGKRRGGALVYDPARDLVWSVGSGFRWPLHVMRFDLKTAKFSEIK
jgi:RNA polymerase sigma factor (sigma-70 family)